VFLVITGSPGKSREWAPKSLRTRQKEKSSKNNQKKRKKRGGRGPVTNYFGHQGPRRPFRIWGPKKQGRRRGKQKLWGKKRAKGRKTVGLAKKPRCQKHRTRALLNKPKRTNQREKPIKELKQKRKKVTRDHAGGGISWHHKKSYWTSQGLPGDRTMAAELTGKGARRRQKRSHARKNSGRAGEQGPNGGGEDRKKNQKKHSVSTGTTAAARLGKVGTQSKKKKQQRTKTASAVSRRGEPANLERQPTREKKKTRETAKQSKISRDPPSRCPPNNSTWPALPPIPPRENSGMQLGGGREWY